MAEIPQLHGVVREHIADHDGEVLHHLLTADVARYVQARSDRHDRGAVDDVLGLMDRALTSGDDRLQNVVAASFVEWFQPGLEQSWSFIATWPRGLREEAGRQRDWSS